MLTLLASIKAMDQLRLAWLLLSPSLSSSVVTILSTLAIVGTSGWLYINHSQAFYDYLFGPYGIATSLIQVPDTTAVFQHWLLGSGTTYYVLLVVTAAIVGLTVFAVLQNAGKVVNTSIFAWQDLQAVSRSRKEAIKEMFTRLALRVVSLLGWSVFVCLFAAILIPFGALLVENGIDKFNTGDGSGLLYISASLALTLASMHLHVVFARLVRLRPRLFGDRDIELAEL
jgi:hypothetical protein